MSRIVLGLCLLLVATACVLGPSLARGDGDQKAAGQGVALTVTASQTAGFAFTPGLEQEVELGRVAWGRDYEAARTHAQTEGKPLAVLFDEVPGCSTCQRYGREALSHPLVAEVLARYTVPVLVRNNVGGAERDVLRRFGEPTWANPSFRLVDPKDESTFVRVAGDYSADGLLGALARSLTSAESQGQGPAWLAIHRGLGQPTRTDTFSMYCFWSGERALGGLPGVVETRTGWQAGSEVVEVTYAPSELNARTLASRARTHSFSAAGAGRLRPTPGDDKYTLRQTTYRFVPLTPTQASRINALGARGPAARKLLSPDQARLLDLIEKHPQAGWPVALGQDLSRAVSAARRLATKLER